MQICGVHKAEVYHFIAFVKVLQMHSAHVSVGGPSDERVIAAEWGVNCTCHATGTGKSMQAHTEHGLQVLTQTPEVSATLL
jgi:hypothetical protein